jgi:hypothetical protein
MQKKYILFLLMLPLIFINSGNIYSQVDLLTDTVFINSVNIKTRIGDTLSGTVSYNEAKKWAYNFSLTLLPDSPPLIDNNAFFLTQYQTVIPVSGYNRELMYKIYIDFLRYSESSVPFSSRLKIYIRDIYGNKKLAGTADPGCMTAKKIFEIPVPFDLSYTGRFDIIIQEHSEKSGCWGIWDLIVSSRKLSEIEIKPVDSEKKIKEIEEKIFK